MSRSYDEPRGRVERLEALHRAIAEAVITHNAGEEAMAYALDPSADASLVEHIVLLRDGAETAEPLRSTVQRLEAFRRSVIAEVITDRTMGEGLACPLRGDEPQADRAILAAVEALRERVAELEGRLDIDAAAAQLARAMGVPYEGTREEWNAMLVRVDARRRPIEVTHEMVRAAAESVAVDDEGAFLPLGDLLDFSGENKTRTVVRAALVAALEVARG